MKKPEIESFLNEVIGFQSENIQAIILLGGIFRDKAIINQWSDIDLIIIWKEILHVDFVKFSDIIANWERLHMMRLDITQMSQHELTDCQLSPYLYNGIVINVLKRENTREILYGSIPDFTISNEQEKQSALFYLNNMLFWQREYYIETLLRYDNNQTKLLLPILIRRTFSIVRAGLRLCDIFCNPYEDSIYHIENLFPNISTKILWEMLNIKRGFDKYDFDDVNLLIEIRYFTEIFVCTIIKKYNNSSHVYYTEYSIGCISIF